MSKPTNSPRIITVATEIATTQATLTKNLKRISTLETELTKLEEQNEGLKSKQAGLARELDRLSVGPEVQA